MYINKSLFLLSFIIMPKSGLEKVNRKKAKHRKKTLTGVRVANYGGRNRSRVRGLTQKISGNKLKGMGAPPFPYNSFKPSLFGYAGNNTIKFIEDKLRGEMHRIFEEKMMMEEQGKYKSFDRNMFPFKLDTTFESPVATIKGKMQDYTNRTSKTNDQLSREDNNLQQENVGKRNLNSTFDKAAKGDQIAFDHVSDLINNANSLGYQNSGKSFGNSIGTRNAKIPNTPWTTIKRAFGIRQNTYDTETPLSEGQEETKVDENEEGPIRHEMDENDNYEETPGEEETKEDDTEDIVVEQFGKDKKKNKGRLSWLKEKLKFSSSKDSRSYSTQFPTSEQSKVKVRPDGSKIIVAPTAPGSMVGGGLKKEPKYSHIDGLGEGVVYDEEEDLETKIEEGEWDQDDASWFNRIDQSKHMSGIQDLAVNINNNNTSLRPKVDPRFGLGYTPEGVIASNDPLTMNVFFSRMNAKGQELRGSGQEDPFTNPHFQDQEANFLGSGPPIFNFQDAGQLMKTIRDPMDVGDIREGIPMNKHVVAPDMNPDRTVFNNPENNYIPGASSTELPTSLGLGENLSYISRGPAINVIPSKTNPYDNGTPLPDNSKGYTMADVFGSTRKVQNFNLN